METSKVIEGNKLLPTLEELRLKREIYSRLENDESGYYLSIIDRKVYPRVWADNFRDGSTIITETPDNTLKRIALGEKDWTQRFTGANIDDVYTQFIQWYNLTHKPTKQ